LSFKIHAATPYAHVQLFTWDNIF